MHLVIIDEDYNERVFMGMELRKAFPKAQLTFFQAIGYFLEEYPNLQQPFVLILEMILPLYVLLEEIDDLEKRLKDLREKFPWLGDDWDGRRGAEVLIRGIRRIQDDLPIIINTDVDTSLISPDIRGLPLLHMTEKDSGCPNLINLLRTEF